MRLKDEGRVNRMDNVCSAIRTLHFVLCLLCSLTVFGCSTGDFPTAPTTGRVICEGQPVPFVMVFFEPMETGKSGLVGKQGFSYANEEGKFSISTYGKNDGAVIGHHRVRVGPPHGEDHPNFKCACVLN